MKGRESFVSSTLDVGEESEQDAILQLDSYHEQEVVRRKASFATLSQCSDSTCARGSASRRPSDAQQEDLPTSGFPIKEWRRGSSIGAGSFGTVFKAQDMDTGKLFAVKESKDTDPKDVQKVMMEIDICSSLRHPNIVSYLGWERRDGKLCIFLEYVAGGSMKQTLSCFGALNDRLLLQATQGCLNGLHFLHMRSPPVVHRDLKCSNILVDLQFNVKLTDFGCSKMSDETKSFTTVGSIPWMAPEVLSGLGWHGRKADVWSLGCTVLEMATAEIPWGRDTFTNMISAWRHIGMTDLTPPLPDAASEWSRDFMSVCLVRDPEMRCTTANLIDMLPHQ